MGRVVQDLTDRSETDENIGNRQLTTDKDRGQNIGNRQLTTDEDRGQSFGGQMTKFGDLTIPAFQRNIMTPASRFNETPTIRPMRPRVKERWVVGGGRGRARGAPPPFPRGGTSGHRVIGPVRDASAVPPDSEQRESPSPTDRRIPHMLSRLRDHLKPGRKEK